MTFLYRFYKLIVPPIARAYFGKVITVNKDRVKKGEVVLFVANHPSALMDPIICGSFTHVPIHFLGRADLFKSKLSSWFLRKSHMWPIYRDIDGRENLEKNDATFKESYAALKNGNPILLYGEGLTDDHFIRRVKTVKKGPARIAFGGEEAYDFKLGIKIVPLGINYTDPNVYGSDLMLRFGTPIKMAEFEQLYHENQVKAMLELTRSLQRSLNDEVIHIDKKERAEDAELIFELDENHFGYTYLQEAPPLEQRWAKTKAQAERINSMTDDEFENLATAVRDFWKKTETRKGERLFFLRILNARSLNIGLDALIISLFFPFALFGALINMPYFVAIKTIPEKLAKRSCFYPGMRVSFSVVLFPILSLIPFSLLSLLVEIKWWMYLPFLPVIAMLAHIALRTRQKIINLVNKRKAQSHFNAITDKEKLKKQFQEIREKAGWVL